MSLVNNQQNGQETADVAVQNQRITEPAHAAAPANADAPPAAPTAQPTNVDRAEEIAAKAAEKAAGAAAACVRGVTWIFASVREAAEDLWAEAQSVRRGDKN